MRLLTLLLLLTPLSALALGGTKVRDAIQETAERVEERRDQARIFTVENAFDLAVLYCGTADEDLKAKYKAALAQIRHDFEADNGEPAPDLRLICPE